MLFLQPLVYVWKDEVNLCVDFSLPAYLDKTTMWSYRTLVVQISFQVEVVLLYTIPNKLRGAVVGLDQSASRLTVTRLQEGVGTHRPRGGTAPLYFSRATRWKISNEGWDSGILEIIL